MDPKQQGSGPTEQQQSFLDMLMAEMYPVVAVLGGCDDPTCSCGGEGPQQVIFDPMVN